MKNFYVIWVAFTTKIDEEGTIRTFIDSGSLLISAWGEEKAIEATKEKVNSYSDLVGYTKLDVFAKEMNRETLEMLLDEEMEASICLRNVNEAKEVWANTIED